MANSALAAATADAASRFSALINPASGYPKMLRSLTADLFKIARVVFGHTVERTDSSVRFFIWG